MNGKMREVKIEGSARPRMIEAYSITEACASLGKSQANFRRWITTELIPAPFLKETQRHHYVYSRGELEIMARILAEHEKEYAYFCAKHEEVSHRIHQEIMGYRDMTYGRGLYGREPKTSSEA